MASPKINTTIKNIPVENDGCSIVAFSQDGMRYEVASPNNTHTVNRVRQNSYILRCNCPAGQFGRICKHISCVVRYWKEIGIAEGLL